MNDPFEVPAHVVPDWMSYRWVRKSIAGELDVESIKTAEAAGWRAVPRSRHLYLSTSQRWDRETDHCEYGGMILMERPDWMTLHAQADLRQKAFEQALHHTGSMASIKIGPKLDIPDLEPGPKPEPVEPPPSIVRRLLDLGIWKLVANT